MGPYLKVVLWIPVGVEDDDSIRGSEVDPHPAGLGADEEREAVVSGLAESIDRALRTHAQFFFDKEARS